VFLLYAAVRNQLATTAALRRLSAVALVNGTLLSVFGLAQFFSSRDQHAVYFSLETAGLVFGPFINRNHFAGYLNLCLALGVGLLLTTGPTEGDRRRRLVQKPNALEEQDEVESYFSPFSVLHSPVQLWICVALAIMLAGLVGSLSRGGVAALVVGLVVTIAVRLTAGHRVRRLDFLIIPVVLLAGLLAWVGIKPLETRLATLWRGDQLADSRWPIWANVLRLVPYAPVAGIGYGTLAYVEPVVRGERLSKEPGVMVVDHAHNDYLEALVEGGLLRFALTVGLAASVITLGVRAVRKFAGRTPGALAFGALLGAVTLALHSFVEFSLTTPAVAVLAAVAAAHLVSMARSDPTVPPSAAHAGVMYVRLNVPARAAACAAALTLGSVLVLQTWQADRVHRLRLAAFKAVRAKEPDFDRAAELLAAVTRVAPDNAEAHLELGQVRLDARQYRLDGMTRRGRASLAATAAAAGPWGAVAAAATWPEAARPDPIVEQRLTEEFVRPALRAVLAARNLCPLLPRAQMRLAANTGTMAVADQPAAYWARARRLAPDDPDLWFFSGIQALRDGRPEDAVAFWARSLNLSGTHLTAVMEAAAARVSPDQLLDRVIPDDARQLHAAAAWLTKAGAGDDAVRPYLDKAVALLDARDGLTAEDWYVKANALGQLDRLDEAKGAYKQALILAPMSHWWRYEYIHFLEGIREYDEAYRELTIMIRTSGWKGLEPKLAELDRLRSR
jgi:O-antigen ligase/tetratricopeptide (TPR) repeat protein